MFSEGVHVPLRTASQPLLSHNTTAPSILSLQQCVHQQHMCTNRPISTIKEKNKHMKKIDTQIDTWHA